MQAGIIPRCVCAGDCVETINRITGKKVLTPFGVLANLQGRDTGENDATENRATFPGTIQAGIWEVFDYSAGFTGLSEKTARIVYWAMAIQGNLTIDYPVNLDLPYAPPFSLAIDHFIATAHIAQNKERGLFDGISAREPYD